MHVGLVDQENFLAMCIHVLLASSGGIGVHIESAGVFVREAYYCNVIARYRKYCGCRGFEGQYDFFRSLWVMDTPR